MAEHNYATTGRNASSAYVGCSGCVPSNSYCLCESIRAFETKVKQYHSLANVDSLVKIGALKLDPRIGRGKESKILILEKK